MVSIFQYLRQDFLSSPQAVLQVLLVFISLIVAFGFLSSKNPDLWQAFLPTLLMGLGYGVVSLSLDQLFREDWEDGTLEWWVSEGKSLELYLLEKLLIHWGRLCLPISLIIGFMTGFASYSLLLGVALTTMALTLLGAIGSALCLKMKSNTSLLLPLLTLPLGIPMMIVSMAAIQDPVAGLSSYITLQGGLLMMALALSFLTCPFALKLSLR